LSNPILHRQEFSRLPMQRRPVADPGTTLVFLSRRGDLTSAEHALTMGEVWWRAPRAVFTVDTRPHGASFTCRLPARGDALQFDASVTYNWLVHDATIVVRDQVHDAEGTCREYLIREMRRITRRVDPINGDPAEQAERGIHAELGQSTISLTNGLSIGSLHAAVNLDPEQANIAKDLLIGTLRQQRDEMAARGHDGIEDIRQSGDLRRRRERIEFYAELVGDRMLANVLAQDPTKATETVQLMFSMEQQKRDKAIQAMRVIIEGGHLQIGDLDPAITAVVSQFTALVSQINTTVAGQPQLGAPASAGDDGAPQLTGAPAADDVGKST
jgi:hypothetical protein